jgi:NADPH:quinone reductase-like Zn-dependent oxidoreductase
VLVHGGAGAVGVFVIQLARLLGAHVVTTVSAHNLDFARELGAHEALDYKAGPFEDRVRDIDVVFDAVGGDTLQRSWGVLNQNGRLVTIAADSEATPEGRIKRAFFIVEPSHGQLVEIGNLLNAGNLRAVVDKVVPLSQASDAYAGKVDRNGRGKIVITIAQAGPSRYAWHSIGSQCRRRLQTAKSLFPTRINRVQSPRIELRCVARTD